METALCEPATFRNADAHPGAFSALAYTMYLSMVCHSNYAAIPHTLQSILISLTTVLKLLFINTKRHPP